MDIILLHDSRSGLHTFPLLKSDLLITLAGRQDVEPGFEAGNLLSGFAEQGNWPRSRAGLESTLADR